MVFDMPMKDCQGRDFLLTNQKKLYSITIQFRLYLRCNGGAVRFPRPHEAAGARFGFNTRSLKICAEVGLKGMKSARTHTLDNRN